MPLVATRPGVRLVALSCAFALASSAGCDCAGRVKNLVDPSQKRQEALQAEARAHASSGEEVDTNDNPQSATRLDVGQPLSPRRAAIASESDVDWYLLTGATADSLVQVRVVAEDPAFDPVLLMAPDGAIAGLVEYNAEGAGGQEAIASLRLAADGRLIAVRGHIGTLGAYTLDVRRKLVGGNVEYEPNDAAAMAVPLTVPGEIQGFYDRPGDRDLFVVDLARVAPQTEVVALEVFPVPGLSQRVDVFANAALEAPLATLRVGPTASALLPNFSLPAGAERLWIALSAEDASFDRERGYRVRFTTPPPPVGAILEREPNDLADNAQPVALGQKLRGYLHHEADQDRLRLEIPAQPVPVIDPARLEGLSPLARADATKPRPQHVLRATLRPQHERHRLALALPSSDGKSADHVAEAPAKGPHKTPIVLCNAPLAPGNHDIVVRALSLGAGPVGRAFDYELELEDVALTPGLEVEPNAAPNQADRVAPEMPRTGFIARNEDIDVYFFEVPRSPDGAEGEARTVRLALSGNSLNLAMNLSDDEGELIAEANTAGPGQGEKLAVDLPAGLYFVRVFASSGFICEPYTVTLSLDSEADQP